MVVTSPGMSSEGSGVYQDLTHRVNAGTQRGRSVGMDPPNGACFAAAGKCEKKQHPDMEPTGFESTLSRQSWGSPSQWKHCLDSQAGFAAF